VETKGGPARAWPAFAAVLGEQQRLLRNMLCVPRVVNTALRTRVGTTPRTVVLEEGTHSLLHYTRETPATQPEPVLLCYALVNRPYILDLQPDKSVVRQYLERGFEVYMIDWGAPSQADRGLTLEHYVSGFLARVVDFVRRKHDRPGRNSRLLHGDDGRAARRHSPTRWRCAPLAALTISRAESPPRWTDCGSSTSMRSSTPTATVGPVSPVVSVHESDPELRRQGSRLGSR
jgi:hypothetical protein